MGWLGYTPREALSANVNHISAALKARADLLNSLFSTEKPSEKKAERRPMTRDRLDAIAAAKYGPRGKRKHG